MYSFSSLSGSLPVWWDFVFVEQLWPSGSGLSWQFEFGIITYKLLVPEKERKTVCNLQLFIARQLITRIFPLAAGAVTTH